MRPRSGWFIRSAWLKAFRSGDGLGHIVIADGTGPLEDVSFPDICCDVCNSDAGVERDDGTEGRIYYDADSNNSLCEPCGLKVEAQALDRVRHTLLARGWKPEDVAGLDTRALSEIVENERLDLAVGLSAAEIAKRLGWDTEAVTYFAARLLEEANVHDLAKTLFKAIANGDEEAHDEQTQ